MRWNAAYERGGNEQPGIRAALEGILRERTGERKEQRCGKTIDIGAFLRLESHHILLNGRAAGHNVGGQIRVGCAHGRDAEAAELHLAVLHDAERFRRDAEVAHAGGVHRAQRGKDRHKQRPRLVPVKLAAAALHKVAQGDALLPLGNGIGRVVFLENIVDLHDGGELTDVGYLARVAQK